MGCATAHDLSQKTSAELRVLLGCVLSPPLLRAPDRDLAEPEEFEHPTTQMWWDDGDDFTVELVVYWDSDDPTNEGWAFDVFACYAGESRNGITTRTRRRVHSDALDDACQLAGVAEVVRRVLLDNVSSPN